MEAATASTVRPLIFAYRGPDKQFKSQDSGADTRALIFSSPCNGQSKRRE